MDEIWKDVKGYEGLYQISNLGRVKSLSREMYNGKAIYISKEKILKKSVDNRGYYSVCLSENNIQKNIKVHQLVAISFLNHTPCGYKLVVDHIDNNPLNNNVNNLQIITQRLNASKDKKNKSSKYIGVSWNNSVKKWVVNIYIKGIYKYLGCFKDELEASNCYQNKLKELNYIKK